MAGNSLRAHSRPIGAHPAGPKVPKTRIFEAKIAQLPVDVAHVQISLQNREPQVQIKFKDASNIFF